MLTSVPFEVADTAEEKMDWDRETAGTEAEAEESMSIGDASGSAEAAAGGATAAAAAACKDVWPVASHARARRSLERSTRRRHARTPPAAARHAAATVAVFTYNTRTSRWYVMPKSVQETSENTSSRAGEGASEEWGLS